MADKRARRRIHERPRLQNGLSIIPSLFTVGNIFCGYYAIIATLRGNYDYAAIAIGVGTVLDTLDGRIARLTKTASEFGVQLDSLADVLTFGAAPALLAFAWGLGATDGIQATVAMHVRQLGWMAGFAFVVCSALRLARFNVQSVKKSPETGSRRYFVGLPTPASAGMIAAVVHFFKSPDSAYWICTFVVFSDSSGFIPDDQQRSLFQLQGIHAKKYGPRFALFSAAMLIGLVIFYSEIVLLVWPRFM